MIGAKERAAGTAPKNKLQKKSYRRSTPRSSKNLKQELGELLFCLEFPLDRELRGIGLQMIERKLHKYYSEAGL